MKTLLAYLAITCIAFTSNAQYFLRGVVNDEKNKPLQNARIVLYSSKVNVTSGQDGTFGIVSRNLYDSISVVLDGFESQYLYVKADVRQTIILKLGSLTVNKNKPRLISITKDVESKTRFNPFINNETYFKLVENEFVNTNDFSKVGFSLSVNKASYSNVRRFINMGSKVPPDAVRVEEMINYFNLGYDEPLKNEVFKINSSVDSCPWNPKNKLLYLSISAKKLDLNKIPPSNLVFLIDVSGSMDMPNRLPLLKEAFQLFVKNLRPIDKVSIVTYGGMVSTWLAPTNGDDKEKINNRLEQLNAAGDTPGESAIEAAYKLARANFIEGGNNRVILATDGDFNVGQRSEKALDELITQQKKTGIYLTCLGVGMGNFKDSKLQTLAQRGNGNYAYIDDLQEAEKVLVQEVTETLYAVADDASVNFNFNPQTVKSYRLIGFDNKRDAVADASSFIEGGEIGSGGNCMAIFEIVPKVPLSNIDILGEIILKYHSVENKDSKTIETISHKITSESNIKSYNKFASAVALFSMKLKESKYIPNVSWPQVETFVNKSVDKSNFQQANFLAVVQKTIKIYQNSKKKRNPKS